MSAPSFRVKGAKDVARALVASRGPSAIESGRYIFWLGAGASRSALIPTAVEMVDRLLDRFWRQAQSRPTDFQPLPALSEQNAHTRRTVIYEWAQHENLLADGLAYRGSSYSRCLELLAGELDRQEFILECVEEGRGRLNKTHLLLAQLLANEYVRIVLTTNFDDLLLRALQLFFRFPAVIDPSSTDTLMTHSKFLQIAYLHGKLNSYRQRHTQADLERGIPGFEAFLTQALQDHGLIVVGYSGGDETPMLILERVLKTRGTGPGRGLYWVSYESDLAKLSPRVASILSLKDTYVVPGSDSDLFFDTVCSHQGIGLGVPDFLRDPTLLAKRVAEMIPEDVSTAVKIPTRERTIAEVAVKTAESRDVADIAASNKQFIDNALSLIEKGEFDRVFALCDSSEKQFPAQAWATRALGLWRSNRGAEADVAFARAVQLNPAGDKVLEFCIRSLLASNNLTEAAQRTNELLRLTPKSATAHKLRGHVLRRNDRHEAAIEAYQKAIELDPSDGFAHDWMGDCFMALDKPADAERSYRQAIAVDPSFTHAYMDLGAALAKQGKLNDAIDAFKRAVELSPKDTRPLVSWALALIDAGRHEEALDILRRAAELDPRDPWIPNWQGDALQQLGRYEEAIEHYRKSVANDPSFFWSYSDQGDSMFALGRFAQALELYKQAQTLRPDSDAVDLDIARALLALRRYDEALEQLTRVLSRTPDHAGAIALRQDVLNAQKTSAGRGDTT